MAEKEQTAPGGEGIPRPVLTIEQLGARPLVEIYGVMYEMLRPDEISPFVLARWTRAGEQLTKALTSAPDEVDPEAEAVIRKRLEEGARAAVPDLPEETVRRMPLQHLLSLLNAFLDQLLQHARSRSEEAAAVLQTSQISSPGSAGSTAARRKRGSKRQGG